MTCIILFITFQKTEVYQKLWITFPEVVERFIFAACSLRIFLTCNNFPLEVNLIL